MSEQIMTNFNYVNASAKVLKCFQSARSKGGSYSITANADYDIKLVAVATVRDNIAASASSVTINGTRLNQLCSITSAQADPYGIVTLQVYSGIPCKKGNRISINIGSGAQWTASDAAILG